MITLDSSALSAVILREQPADVCREALAANSERVISAGTHADALIVAGRSDVASGIGILLEGLAASIVPVPEAVARAAAQAYARSGKSVHPAALNFADCFADVTARDDDCLPLYIGSDFA